MPPPASSERPATSGELVDEVVLPRRSPPPHLGNAYRNVFVETAALEVVITLPGARPGAARPSGLPGAPAGAAVVRGPAPPGVPLPQLPHPLGAGDEPLTGGGRGGQQVQVSRRALVVLVVLAGLGLLAVAVLAAVGATLLLGGAVGR